MTPRFFIAHPGSERPAASDPSAISQVLDVFRLAGDHGTEEWLVGTDPVGGLVAVPIAQRERLSASAHAQLTHHEVSTGKAPRAIAASEVHLLGFELLEQPAEAEGLNDPIYLYGTLHGPLGSGAGQVLGQLTLTRGDLLAGLARSERDAFLCAEGGGRVHHAMLPADRLEEISSGRGVVLAYPLQPPELQAGSAANANVAARLISDVLAHLQADARAHGGSPAIAALDLPVPSLHLAILELQAQGYEIRGEWAVIQRKTGLLPKVAGWLTAEKVKLPREAAPAEFFALARQALAALPGWPTEVARALEARVRPGALGAPVPRPSVPLVTMRLPPRPPQAPVRPNDWMQDFLAAHQKPGKAPPKLTHAPPPAPPRAQGWMGDFAAPAPAPKPKIEKTPAPETKKPAWMSDFEK